MLMRYVQKPEVVGGEGNTNCKRLCQMKEIGTGRAERVGCRTVGQECKKDL